MTTEDIFSYRDTLGRTENEDLLHNWIGTYNLYIVEMVTFVKWLYEPDINSEDRQTS